MFLTILFLTFGDDGPDAGATKFSKMRPWRMSAIMSPDECESILKSQKSSATENDLVQNQVPWMQVIKSKDVLVISLSWYFIYIYCKSKSHCKTRLATPIFKLLDTSLQMLQPRVAQYLVRARLEFATRVRTVMSVLAVPIMAIGATIIDKLVVRYSSGPARKLSFVAISFAALLVGLVLIFNACRQLLALCSLGM